ncbi:hypothetical protein PR202_ga16236 [Eleusine coracana subsp. coracana]|uniref:4-hydroxy-tetrahydrodipicolinate synthase n=1 Tax=Eleusine coracana subsp. coracana TaxID=191504 RepID=A0AAV5CL36_ELECO|nr:hypothetical protein PR202_ga16236 [Eleusine coracana subsp. coracana]
MHAALHINPYYGKTSSKGLISHFKTVLPMGPTIIYNVPSRTGQDIPPSVIEVISGYPNMAGVKECVGHERVKRYTDKGITVWSGNDDECHDSRWKYGATGVISVASNLVPGLMRSLMYEGENVTLREKLSTLMKWLFCEPNPIALNTALAQLGVARPVFRLPYEPLPLEKRVEFVRIVEAIGRNHFVGQKETQVLDDDDFVSVTRCYSYLKEYLELSSEIENLFCIPFVLKLLEETEEKKPECLTELVQTIVQVPKAPIPSTSLFLTVLTVPLLRKKTQKKKKNAIVAPLLPSTHLRPVAYLKHCEGCNYCILLVPKEIDYFFVDIKQCENHPSFTI